MEKMLQIIKSELETWHYKFFEPSSYDDCLTESSSEVIQSFLQDPNSDSVLDFWMDWDNSYDFSYVESALKEELSRKGYSDEEIEDFFDKEDDNIRDYIYEYCDQSWLDLFKKYFERSRDFTYTYYIGDMEADTSIEDLICPAYNIHSVENIEEQIDYYHQRALRYGILLGYTIEELYKSYFSEDSKEQSTYKDLETIALNDLDYATTYFAFRMSSKEILNLRNVIENWDVVRFTKWEWWTIDTGVGSGWMWSGLDFSDREFVFNWWRLTIDEETWAYPYYDKVVGTSAEYWDVELIEKHNWEEIPNEINNLVLEATRYRAQKEQYRKTWCGWISCNIFTLHKTSYNNDYPAGWTCSICGKFFID